MLIMLISTSIVPERACCGGSVSRESWQICLLGGFACKCLREFVEAKSVSERVV